MIWLARILLQRKLKLQQRKVYTHNLQTARTALLVYDASKEESEKIVRNFARFLKEERIEVSSLGYYKLKNKQDQAPKAELKYHYFTQKDLNWLKQLKQADHQKIIQNEYDLMVDLNLEDQFCLEQIASLANASFKVGASGTYRDNICDLTIRLNQNKLESLIEELKKYLQMLNRKTA